MKKIKFPFLFLIVFVFGCSSEKSFETRISGYYKVISIESNVDVDLNNDGVKSTNIYKEITDLYSTPDDQKVSFYDFEAFPNYMEVRPLKSQSNNAKLISLNIPDQRIDESGLGQFYLSSYAHSFIHYSYELDATTSKIELINNNPDFQENGSIKSFQLQTDGTLLLNMTKDVFDFVESKWIEVDLILVYQSVD